MTTTTRLRVLTSAQRLVQRRGYQGLRFADVSDDVGVRRPSIHHHFPTKADLARETIASYREALAEQLARIDREATGALERIDGYVGLYRAVLEDDVEHMCPGGMLAADALSLPEKVRGEVDAFFSLNVRWVAQVLATGVDEGVVRVAADEANARQVVATLQGSLLLARLHQSPPSQLDAAAHQLREWLTAKTP